MVIMKNKHVIELDFEGIKQDIKSKKLSLMEFLELMIVALNAGYDLVEEGGVFKFFYQLNMRDGVFKKVNGVYYLDKEALKNPVNFDDLKDLEKIKVCESREEWEGFKEQQQKEAKRRQVEKKLKERRQARRSKPRI